MSGLHTNNGPNGAPARSEGAAVVEPSAAGGRGPLGLLLGLFSSVWLGVFLLVVLFVYSSVGSSGVPLHPNIFRPDAWVSVRQLPAFELTEFEWFHTWFFKLLIALICINLVVATLRRIPLSVVNLGVWMIHTGIIVLSLSCVWYFGTKVEGDTPVARRAVLIEADGMAPQRLLVRPGNQAMVEHGGSLYAVQVEAIDPHWQSESGGDHDYRVDLRIVDDAQRTFTHTLVAGDPDFADEVRPRELLARLPGGEEATLAPRMGAGATVGPADAPYVLQVAMVDPAWELLSGPDEGTRAFSVTVAVEAPDGRRFRRQVIDGFPQYTEDILETNDPQQPFKRAVKELGTPLVDEALVVSLREAEVDPAAAPPHPLKMSLVYEPQEHLYLMSSSALYLREAGTTEWIQRPIENLPRYNDYIASLDDVWLAEGDTLRPRAMHVDVPPVRENDPLAGRSITVSRYLRYAAIETRRIPGSGELDPMADVHLDADSGEHEDYRLVAFDPERNAVENGALRMFWIDSAEQLAQLRAIRPATITVTIPESDTSLEHEITDIARRTPSLPFTPVEGTEYSFRVDAIEDNLNIAGRTLSLARIEVRKGEDSFLRWVFDDPALNRDLPAAGDDVHGGGTRPFDEGIRMSYQPGNRPPLLAVVAGPEEDTVGIMVGLGATTEASYQQVRIGEVVEFRSGTRIRVTNYSSRSRAEQRPFVVPRAQRDRDVGEMASMVRVEIPDGGAHRSLWLPYHHYVFDSPDDVLRRFPFRPTRVRLSDGRQVEVMFGRQRVPLPTEVALESFKVTTHIGGFTGRTSSIRDWTSLVRFRTADGWTDSKAVSMNDPKEHNGFWFYQAQWDPPDEPRFQGDPGSQGLNYTVLGAGNRNGVMAMLVGCCIAVIGMIYAFYVKPFIKRRRQQAVYATVTATRGAAQRMPVAAAVANRERETAEALVEKES